MFLLNKKIWIFLAIVSIAFLLRFLTIQSEAVCGDELFSRDVAVDLFGAGMAQIRTDLVHPPVYYFFLHPVLQLFGDNPLSLRLISLISGVLTVAVAIGFVTTVTQSFFAGIFTGCLLTMSSPLIFYSQQARSYSFYSFVFLLVVIVLDHVLEKPQKKRGWIVLAALISLVAMTHYFAVLYFVAIALVILLFYRDRRLLLKYALACLPACVLIGVWALYLLPAYQHHGGVPENLSWIDTPGWYSLAWLFAKFNGLPEMNRGTTISLFFLFLLTMLTALKISQEKSYRIDSRFFRRLCLVFWLTIFPPVLLFAMTRPPLSMTVWGDRHLIPSQISLVIFVALAAWFVAGKNKKAYMALFFIFMGLQILGSAAWLNGPMRLPFNAIAKNIAKDYPDGVEVFTTWTYGIGAPVNYYSKNKNLVKSLSDHLDRLPERFILLYRPEVKEEQHSFDEIRHRGWSVVDVQEFVAHEARKVSMVVMDKSG